MVEVSCRGLLFDLDGVLVDSTPAVARVWTTWAVEHGLDPEETVRRAHGRPSVATIRELVPTADVEKQNNIILRDGDKMKLFQKMISEMPPELKQILEEK